MQKEKPTQERPDDESLAAAIEKRVFSKTAWRILPLVIVLYVVSFLDRVNIGFAALTMNKEIGLAPAAFGFGAGIFFIGYFLFEVPSNLILQRVGARRWIARVMISWAIVSASTAFVTGAKSFAVARFLLGIAEAGFFPGIILYLSYWFVPKRRSFATSFFILGAPLAGVVGSPISTALLGWNGLLGLRGWQWLFLMEAVPAFLLGLLVWCCMTDRPADAAWLSGEEQEWLMSHVEERSPAVKDWAAEKSAWAGLRDRRVMILSVVYLGLAMALYVMGLWMPLMIGGFGLSLPAIGWLSAIPNLVASVGMVVWAYHSDQTNERLWHVIIGCLIAAAGMAFAGLTRSAMGTVIAFSFAAFGMNAARPPLWSLPTQFLTGSAAAAGIAAINSFGNLGGFLGPFAVGWLKGATGKYSWGLGLVALALIISAIALLAMGPVSVKDSQKPRLAFSKNRS